MSRRTVWAAIAVLLAYIAILIVGGIAQAHEGHTVTNAQYQLQLAPQYKPQGEMKPGTVNQRHRFLYGLIRDRESYNYGKIDNCCQYEGGGDCTLVKVEDVRIVPGGYEVGGEFIPEAETTLSPDENFYRCRHSHRPVSHCFFAPPQGF